MLPESSILMPTVQAVILDATKSLQYGSVETTIHDSRVLQIECTRKIRLCSEPGK